jgi:hypothetical protein
MAEILCPSQRAFARKPGSCKPSRPALEGSAFIALIANIRPGFAFFRPIRAEFMRFV